MNPFVSVSRPVVEVFVSSPPQVSAKQLDIVIICT